MTKHSKQYSRRDFIRLIGAGTCGAVCHQLAQPLTTMAYAFPNSSAATVPGRTKRFVEIFMYGGCCTYGMSPIHNAGAQAKYPTLYRNPSQAVYIGHNDIGLHTGFAPFITAAGTSNVALVVGTGHPTDYSRSHDIAQRANEQLANRASQVEANGIGVGAAVAAAINHPLSLISFGGNTDFGVGGSIPPRSIGSLATGKANFYQNDWFTLAEQNVRAGAGQPQTASQQLVSDSIDSMNTNLKTLQSISQLNPPTAFPNTSIGRYLADVTRLIMADVGASVFFIPIGGFDTHSGQAAQHNTLFGQIGVALAAFATNLKAIPGVAGGTAWDETAGVFRTDFGRTFENNGQGTDHGLCYNQIVFGGNVAGGVYGDVPTQQALLNAPRDYMGPEFVQFNTMQPTKEIIASMGVSVQFPEYPGNIRVPIGIMRS